MEETKSQRRIETVRLKNFKSFQDTEMTDLPNFCIVVGANGSGKTTLFDVFGFLKDCITLNVNKALKSRGGFREVISRGHQKQEIEIEIQFRLLITAGVDRRVTYQLKIGLKDNRPLVTREILRYKRGRYGSPYHFLDFEKGSGYAITNEEDFKKSDQELDREHQELGSKDTLAIKGLGQFQRFKAAHAFLQLIEHWHISDLNISMARGSKDIASESDHLSVTGDNLQLVASDIYENHPDIFKKNNCCHETKGAGH